MIVVEVICRYDARKCTVCLNFIFFLKKNPEELRFLLDPDIPYISERERNKSEKSNNKSHT